MLLDDTPYQNLWDDYDEGKLPEELSDLCFYFSETGCDGHFGFFLKAEKKGILHRILTNCEKRLPSSLFANLKKAHQKWAQLNIDVAHMNKKQKEEAEEKADFSAEDVFFADNELSFIRLLNGLEAEREGKKA